METRAPYVLIGSFVLAAIVAVFGFVYWLNNTGGIGPRTNYHVQFQGPVPGLLVGAGVLFNGIRVGEVTQLGLAPDNPRFVNATISVAATTPVRTDTKVGLDFQGLTGVPVVTLEGGMIVAKSGALTLIAEAGAGQSMTQAARDALRRVDTVLEDNSGPLKDTIANLRTFSDGLARNTGKIDGILAGLEKMTGRNACAKGHLRFARAAKSRACRQDALGVTGHSRADRRRDAPDPAHAVRAQRGQSGLCGISLGRQHSKAGAGAAHRQL